MQTKAPARSEIREREDRELQLKEFIRGALEAVKSGPGEILLVARAPESVAAKALFAMSDECAARQIRARIVFAGGALVKTGEAWHLSFDPAFQHEIRILHDGRFLDGHEQLVLGVQAQWFGDSMRREPDKRDAFAMFKNEDEVGAGRSRATFDRLWSLAVPVYAHSLDNVRDPVEVSVVTPPHLAGLEAEKASVETSRH